MIELTANKAPLREVFGWAATNLLVVFFIVMILAITFLGNLPLPGLQVTFIILSLVVSCCGGIFISFCQLLFLRLRHIKIPGGGKQWTVQGILGSLLGIFGNLAVLLLVAFSTNTQTPPVDEEISKITIAAIFAVVCVQKVCLAIAQGILLIEKRYAKVWLWLGPHIIGYGLGLFISVIIIFIKLDFLPDIRNRNAELVIFLSLIIVLVEIASAWRFIKVLGIYQFGMVHPALR